MTASPMNFSTVPPCDSTIAFIRSKYAASSARKAPGSSRSPSSVEPVTSQKSTVTALRCSRSAGASSNDAVQKPQKRKPTGFFSPQEGQSTTRRVYCEPPSSYGTALE
jgi:hypothetical protein